MILPIYSMIYGDLKMFYTWFYHILPIYFDDFPMIFEAPELHTLASRGVDTFRGQVSCWGCPPSPGRFRSGDSVFPPGTMENIG
jgi:hypothetical protein